MTIEKSPDYSVHKTIFFATSDSKKKMEKITEICHQYFENKKNLLILAPHKNMVFFIDELLWNFPEKSFLPHDLIKEDKTDYRGPIFITTNLKNLFNSNSIFNLSGMPIDLLKNQFNTIYEFEDTSSEKKNLSFKSRLLYYKEAKRRIISYPL